MKPRHSRDTVHTRFERIYKKASRALPRAAVTK